MTDISDDILKKIDSDWIQKKIVAEIKINPIGQGGHAFSIPDNVDFNSWNLTIHLWTGLVEEKESNDEKSILDFLPENLTPVYLMAQLVNDKDRSFLPEHKYIVHIYASYPSYLLDQVDLTTGKPFEIRAGIPYDNKNWATGKILEIT